jgi:hypothetical protein
VQSAIRKGETYSFADMLAMTNESWNRRVSSRDPRAGLMYTQAWSMVHFLVHAEGGRYAERFEEYLQLVADGRDSAGAFGEAFGSTDHAPFEQAWREFTLALRPDPVSTATERLEFIGAGLGALRDRGVAVASVDELKTRLREWGFVLRRSEHGLERSIDASDDRLFQAPEEAAGGGKKKPAPAELTLVAPDRPGAPMGAQVAGLRVKVRLVWRPAEPGRWVSDIVYE